MLMIGFLRMLKTMMKKMMTMIYLMRKRTCGYNVSTKMLG